MNLHYPLHTQNFWAAASLRRPATSLRRLAISVVKVFTNTVISLFSLFRPARTESVICLGETSLADSDCLFALSVVQSLHRWFHLSPPLSPCEDAALSTLLKDWSLATSRTFENSISSISGDIVRFQTDLNLPTRTAHEFAFNYSSQSTSLPFKVYSLGRLLVAQVSNVAGLVSWPARFVREVFARVSDYRTSALQRAALVHCLENARTYCEWRVAATELDRVEGLSAWKEVDLGKLDNDSDTSGCDLKLIRARLHDLCSLFKRGNSRSLAFNMRNNLIRNIGGICHPDLYCYCRVGTKSLVEDYVNVSAFSLMHVAYSSAEKSRFADVDGQQSDLKHRDSNYFSVEDKLKFFNETRHAYGRTALMLSGGAAMGLNHLGVVKALLDCDLLPRVVSGTSAGAIVAAIVGIFDDNELHSILRSDDLINPITGQPFSFRYFDESLSMFRRIRRVVRKGAFQDIRMLQDSLRRNFGDLSFGEAYSRSRRILNITVCPAKGSSGPPLLLNYLTTPNVLIWSAASASCALPFVFAPVQLVAKDATGCLVPFQQDGSTWMDGSITSDVPLARIGELFNVNHFIVSQTNPHIIPRGLPLFQTRIALLIKSELQFRYWQALQLKLVPRVISSLFPHMMQPYEGDVTIMPEVSFRDLFGLFRNPTPEAVHRFLLRGERQTFPKLDRVRLQCIIERTLDACVDIVAREARHMQKRSMPGCCSLTDDYCRNELQSSFGRAPSWLWVESLGVDSPAFPKHL